MSRNDPTRLSIIGSAHNSDQTGADSVWLHRYSFMATQLHVLYFSRLGSEVSEFSTAASEKLC